MVWVRLDDAIGEHPKIAAISDSALALFVTSLAYCNRNLTDGFIPHQVGFGQLRYCDGNATPAIRELEDIGLWEKGNRGWAVHDYLDYNPSREKVLAEREQKRAAGKAGGQASAQARGRASALAPAQAEPQAESKPVPVPVPSTSKPMSIPSPSEMDGFEEFWKAYPRKDGKRKAVVKYAAALKRAAAETILSGARAYAVEVQGRERSKIKMAEGWLEGDRWEDSSEVARPAEPEREYFVAREVDDEAVAGFAATAAANPPSWSKRKDPLA